MNLERGLIAKSIKMTDMKEEHRTRKLRSQLKDMLFLTKTIDKRIPPIELKWKWKYLHVHVSYG